MSLDEKKQWIYKIIFAVAIYILTYAVVIEQMSEIDTDYLNHAENVMNVQWSSFFQYILNENPYFVWHFLVKVIYNVFRIPIEHSAATVSAATALFLYLLINYIVKCFYNVQKSELISFLVLLVGPIYIPWFNPNIYLGQGSPNTWHNPTNLIVKPFAVVCFFIIVFLLDSIHKDRKIEKGQFFGLSVFLLLSVLAKPSFLQGFIPGLGMYMVFFSIKEKFKYIKQYLLICLMFVPSVVWMMWQFIVAFYTGKQGAGIGIGWLEVLSRNSPNVAISMLLLLLFPVIYLITNISRIYRDTDIQLVICWEVAAWLESALFYENGKRKGSGNFGWAQLVSVFVLWVVIFIHFVKDVKEMGMDDKKELVKNSVLFVVFLLHLFCGILYLFYLIAVDGMWL